MKKLAAIIALCSSLMATESNGDKHFAFSVGIAVVTDQVIYHATAWSSAERIAATMAATMVFGLAKEIRDKHFSASDLAYDLAGTVFGTVVSETVIIYVKPVDGGAVVSANIAF